MSTLLIAGALRTTSPDRTTSKYDASDGSLDFYVDHGGDIHCVAVDINGNFYAGGVRVGAAAPYPGVRKYDSAGNLQWSYDDGNTVFGVKVDVDGNVYLATNRNCRKLNSSGTSQWSYNHGNTLNAIAIDSSSNVYVGGVVSTSRTLYKRNSAGTQQWAIDTGGTVTAVAVDSGGNVYAGHNSGALKKYNSSGTEITTGWNKNHGDYIRCAAVDADDNLIIVGNRTSDITTRKFNSAGTEQWTADHGAAVYGVAVDVDGNIYTGGDSSSGDHIRKYSSSGGSPTYSIAEATRVTSVAVASLGLINIIPALPLALALGIPWNTVYDVMPGLALPLALAVPTMAGLPPVPDFSDLAGYLAELAELDPAWIPYATLAANNPAGVAALITPTYDGTVTGPGELLSLPLSAIECRRELGQSTWLTVRTVYSAVGLAALTARMGSELLVFAGIRVANLESSGIFLRSVLTDVAYTRSPQGGELRLTGRVQTPSYSATTRALTGLSSLQTVDGRRTVRCDVDPLLRPNDTATWGGESWIVGIIQYEITPQDAWMRVTETL